MTMQPFDRHHTATAGIVVPFPLSRYAAKVREVARKHGRALLMEGSATDKCHALNLWRDINGPLLQPLKGAGIRDAVIMRELDGFAQAVERELGRRAWMEASGLNPDDAA